MKSLNTLPPTFQISLLTLLLMISYNSLAQQATSYRIAFYNLENLFHPDDDTLKNDEAFTPEGDYNWSPYRYREKCHRMAKAILSIGEWQPPAVVGVAEVENRKALNDLASTDVLKKFNYQIVHFESPDRRGIDVGMLYRADLFEVYDSRPIKVSLKGDEDFATRDILYVKGSFEKKDTVHLFFNHWPSRYGGQAQSEPKRISAATTLRSVTDSLHALPYPTYMVIAGDFNDEHSNISLKDSLISPPATTPYLTNLMAALPVQHGSHRYRGTWSYLDQVIVSNNLLSTSVPAVAGHAAHVVDKPYLLTTDDRYPGQVPYRTFIGRTYQGGFSDHLPVYIDLQFSNKIK